MASLASSSPTSEPPHRTLKCLFAVDLPPRTISEVKSRRSPLEFEPEPLEIPSGYVKIAIEKWP